MKVSDAIQLVAENKDLSGVVMEFLELEERKLTTAARDNLKDSDFALPGRRYPIHDLAHARNALARVAQNGTPEEKEIVRRKVHQRYPEVGQD